MEVKGKIIQILEKQTGKSAKGEWSKQLFIIETTDEYPKKVCIMNWGSKVDLSSFKVEDEVNAFINIESREYNGKWYTDVKLWRMDKTNSGTTSDNNDNPEIPEGLDNDDPMGEMPF